LLYGYRAGDTRSGVCLSLLSFASPLKLEQPPWTLGSITFAMTAYRIVYNTYILKYISSTYQQDTFEILISGVLWVVCDSTDGGLSRFQVLSEDLEMNLQTSGFSPVFAPRAVTVR